MNKPQTHDISSERGGTPAIRHLAVFGSYSDHDLYQRNRTLVELLTATSESAVFITPEKRDSHHHLAAAASLGSRLGRLISDGLTLWRRRRELAAADVIFVPYPAYLELILLRLMRLRRDRFVIADAFLELHSTVVEDRQLFPPGGLRAKALIAFQRLTLSFADVLLIDTVSQGKLLKQRLLPSETKVRAVPVGIDERLWTPLERKAPEAVCEFLFWGTFIPLHGVETIFHAASILQSRGAAIHIRMIGDGQTAPLLASLRAGRTLENLSWERELQSTSQLREALARTDAVLGIFGASAKAGDVIPYKVHQAMASNKPVVTRGGGEVDAIAEEKEGLFTCAAADAEALASAMEQCQKALKSGLVPSTRNIFDAHFGAAVIAQRLSEVLPPTSQYS
ncbi:MAG: glycosyltransferase [Pseudomonadota bacterium]